MQGERTLITDEGGNYRFNNLPPGTYNVKYDLPGFKTLVRDGIIVQTGTTATVNVALEVASVAETVTVTGESPVVDIEQANIGVNFGSTLKDNIVSSRNYWSLLSVTPGIKTLEPDVGGSTMGTQVNYRSYGKSGQVKVMLDGVDLTEGNDGGSLYGDFGSWEEVNVSSAGNSAEIGTAGSTINAVVRNGGNKTHGKIYLGYEKGSFQSTNIDQNLRNKGITAGDSFTRYTDWNLDIGGPIKKDKFWYYGSFRNEYSGLATELRQNTGARYVLPATGKAPPLCGPGELPCIGDNPDGAPRGGLFYTRLQNGTTKLTYQINANNQLSTTANMRLKLQPNRGGQGTGARDLTADAAQRQESWFHTINAVWTSTLSNKTTLNVSTNNFGYYWINRANVDSIRIFDRGSSGATRNYTQGSFIQDLMNNRRWHETVLLSHFFEGAGGSHNLKVGYNLAWEDRRRSVKGYPGHVRYVFFNGNPDRLEVFNTPIQWAQYSLLDNSFFVQDKWQIKRRLTLNVGFRLDHYVSYLPEQVRESAGGNPFATANDIPGLETFGNTRQAKQTVGTFNQPVPRVSFIYDLFGNGKTAIKASYGRFSFNPSYDLASNANDNKEKNATYNWDGTLPINTPAALRACLAAPGPNSGRACSLQSGPNLTRTQVDPNLKNPYITEFTLGIDQQLFRDWNFRFNFVRKIDEGRFDSIETAYATTDYVPFQFRDPGRDGRAGTPDDSIITAYNRAVATRPDRPVVQYNDASGDMFRTWEIEAVKRFSNRWQVLAGADWTKRDLGPDNFTTDPNILITAARLGYGHYWDWTSKFVIQYELPWAIRFSSVYKGQKGDPSVSGTGSILKAAPGTRILQVNCDRVTAPGQTCAQAGGAAPRQGAFNIMAEPRGVKDTFYPTLNLWDISFSKEVKREGLGKAEFSFDLFNVTNANTVRGWTLTTGTTTDASGAIVPTFQRPTTILNPRIFRLGLRLTF
jgi:hypothetical protein